MKPDPSINPKAVRRIAVPGSAPILTLSLILNVSLIVSYLGLWIIAARQDLLWRADFTMLYTGWSMARDGKGNMLYHFDLQAQYQQTILAGRSFANGLLPYDYPPHVALLFAPMALIPRTTAYAVWAIGQLLLVIWLIRLILRLTDDWSRLERWLAITTTLAFPPLLLTCLLGSFSLLLLICLLQFYLKLKSEQEVRSGIWLAIGSIKPQSLLLAGIALIGARRWRLLCVVGLAGVFLAVVCSLVFGWQIWWDFGNVIREVSGFNNQFGIVPRDMYNFKSLLIVLLGETHLSLINAISFLALGLCAAFTLWLWRGNWQPVDPSFDLKWSLTILLGLVFSLHIYPQDGLLLVAPALWFYQYLRQREIVRTRYAIFILACPPFFLASEFIIESRLGFRLPVLAILGLLVWVTLAWMRDERSPSESKVQLNS